MTVFKKIENSQDCPRGWIIVALDMDRKKIKYSEEEWRNVVDELSCGDIRTKKYTLYAFDIQNIPHLKDLLEWINEAFNTDFPFYNYGENWTLCMPSSYFVTTQPIFKNKRCG